MATITKKDLIQAIAESTRQSKVVTREIIQSFLDRIIEELGSGNRLEFREFGVFEVRARAARRAQNPRTLERVQVPEKRVVKFKAGRLMRQRVAAEKISRPRRGRAAGATASQGRQRVAGPGSATS